MILITGGLGYLGSHLVAKLLEEGHKVVIVDNLSHGRMEMLKRLEKLSGQFISFIKQDIRNTPALQKIFEQYQVSAVVHFAAVSQVTDSMLQPLDYYNNNISGLLSLLRVMQRTGVNKLLMGSSVSVYGNTQEPVDETATVQPITPYSKALWMCEQILADSSYLEQIWRMHSLRFSNIAGAHPSNVVGDLPCGMLTKLFPKLTIVGQQIQPSLSVYGDNYATPDGTCIRDYLHVQDAVEACMQSLALLHASDKADYQCFNIASGQSHSVLQVVEAFSQTNTLNIETHIEQPREGDIEQVYIDISKANNQLKWQPKHDLPAICQDSWTFYKALQNKDSGSRNEHNRTNKSANKSSMRSPQHPS